MLVDCLTLWLSNHMLADHDLDALSAELEEVLAAPRGPWFVVSNEVGLGIVPDNALAGVFATLQGGSTSASPRVPTSVLFMVAGLPHAGEMMKPIDEKEEERHRAKMAKRKAVQDAEVAGKTVAEKGLLIVNTGPGKGKTTAAFGLALRMLGYGQRVGVVQFVKGAWHTGEKDAFAAFGDKVVWHTMGEGFTWETQDIKRDIAAAEAAWAKALELHRRSHDQPRRARRTQHRAALRLSRPRRSGCGAEGPPP